MLFLRSLSVLALALLVPPLALASAQDGWDHGHDHGNCQPQVQCDVCTSSGTHTCHVIACDGNVTSFTENCTPVPTGPTYSCGGCTQSDPLCAYGWACEWQYPVFENNQPVGNSGPFVDGDQDAAAGIHGGACQRARAADPRCQ